MGWSWNSKQTVQKGNTVTVLEFNSDGFRAILSGDGVYSLIKEVTEGIANAAGPGFEPRVFYGGFGGGRFVGSVSTTDYASMKDEAETKALERAIGK